MRILHLYSGGLPDIRVERTAYTAKKEGYNTCFAGSFVRGLCFPAKVFDQYYELPFNSLANIKFPSYWISLRRKLSQILREYHPDLIHAHNIIAANLISDFRVPFVYDDYEYWSKHCEARAHIKYWRPVKIFKKWLYSKWEKKVLRKASAVIVTCKTVAKEYRKSHSAVYVTPNFPSRIETESLELDFNKRKHLSSVYIGRDCSRSPGRRDPYRDVKGLLQIFHHNDVGTLTVFGDPDLPSSRNINSRGFLFHQKMMEELTQHHIGLIPWKKHWLHRYKQPNKPYEYAHAGLLVLTISDLNNVIESLGKYCVTFNDTYELEELLRYYADNLNEVNTLRTKIREFVLNNLTWEKKCEPEILRAYSKI